MRRISQGRISTSYINSATEIFLMHDNSDDSGGSLVKHKIAPRLSFCYSTVFFRHRLLTLFIAGEVR